MWFTYSQNLARAWVDAELNTQSRYIEGVGLSPRDAQVASLVDFVQDGCDIIVVGSDAMQDLTLEFADVYRNVTFICLTCCCFDARPNVASIEINNYEAAYISGVVAAMQEGIHTLAYVGSTYVPPSFRNLNAFALGAFSVRPNITMLVSHVGSWFDLRTERIVSKHLILQHGADLLAYDSDSTTIVEVAKEMGKLSIAAKVDGTAVHGESNLMSRIRLWNAPLLGTMTAAVGLKNWTIHKDDNAVVGFAEQAVSLGTFSSRVSVQARIRAEQLSQAFTARLDPTWCLHDGQVSFPAFCPEDANIVSTEMGGHAPNALFPCSLPGGHISPEDGNCLSWAQQRSMAWIAEGYTDLGLVEFPAECVAGTRMDFTGTELCVPCAPGSISLVVDLEECELCVQGRFAVDGLECRQCPAGTYTASAGSSACEACPAGSFASQDGQTQCTLCPEGYLTSAAGQQTCDRCPVGAFSNQSGSSSCTPCAEGKTTQYNAATTSSDCICPEGSYRDYSGVCSLCLVGMVCNEGSDVAYLPSQQGPHHVCESQLCVHPQALPGYMSLPDAPLRMYKCLTEAACPGGLPGTVSRCGSHRADSEVACGVCAFGSFENGDENCEKCERNEGTLLAIVLLVMAVAAVVTTSFAVNRDLLMQGHGMLNVIIIGGVLLTAIQTTSVFSQLELDWVHPLQGVVSFATRTFTFNIKLLRIACHVPISPVSRFCASQLVAPSCVPILALALLVKKYIFKTCSVSMSADLVNSIGTICSVFFIAVSMTAIQPLVCYPHPTDSDTGSSMLSEPAVLCWSDDERHAALVVVATISFVLVPASFFSACLFAMWMRSRIMVSDSKRRWWLHAFRFLFFRFKPGKHVYGIVLLLRNLTICLIPALIPGDLRALQVVLLLLVLQVSATYQNTMYPFSTLLANLVDSCVSVVLILVLVLGMLKTGIEVDNHDMIVLSSLVLAMGLAAIGGGICAGLRSMCFRSVRFYYFLSHHKADAAAQARFLQMLIKSHLRRRCFLDSDNLVDLAVLFDIVKTSVSHFVVLLTRETLRRPWCVGEIIIALEAKLAIARILHPSFQKPTENDMDDITKYIPQQGSLANFHIDSQRIAPALRTISAESATGLATITMESSTVSCISTFVFHNVIQELSQGAGQGKMNPSLPRFQDDSLVISTDTEDHEAAAAGGILMSSLQDKGSIRMVAGIICVADIDACMSRSLRNGRAFTFDNSSKDMPESVDGIASVFRCVATSRAVILVLSSYSLQCREQINVIDIAVAQAKHSIPVCTPQFHFPTDLYFSKHLPTLIRADQSRTVVASVKRFFSQIAITMTTHASQLVLQAEMDQVMARIPLKKPEPASSVSRTDQSQIQTVSNDSIGWQPTSSKEDVNHRNTIETQVFRCRLCQMA